LSKVATVANTITVDINSALPIVAAGIASAQAAKIATPGLSLFHRIALAIEGSAVAAESFPNLEVDAVANLAALVAGLVNLL
jgi:hypothetical protein